MMHTFIPLKTPSLHNVPVLTAKDFQPGKVLPSQPVKDLKWFVYDTNTNQIWAGRLVHWVSTPREVFLKGNYAGAMNALTGLREAEVKQGVQPNPHLVIVDEVELARLQAAYPQPRDTHGRRENVQGMAAVAPALQEPNTSPHNSWGPEVNEGLIAREMLSGMIKRYACAQEQIREALKANDEIRRRLVAELDALEEQMIPITAFITDPRTRLGSERA